MEILQFIFSDGWHWFGTLLLICIPLLIIGETVTNLTQNRKDSK